MQNESPWKSRLRSRTIIARGNEPYYDIQRNEYKRGPFYKFREGYIIRLPPSLRKKTLITQFRKELVGIQENIIKSEVDQIIPSSSSSEIIPSPQSEIDELSPEVITISDDEEEVSIIKTVYY